jgi:hypothetical protein
VEGHAALVSARAPSQMPGSGKEDVTGRRDCNGACSRDVSTSHSAPPFNSRPHPRDQYRRSVHISTPGLGEPPSGYERKSRPHLNDSDGPNSHDRGIGAQKEWPHRAGSHRVPARLRDPPWRRWGRDGPPQWATSGVRVTHPKIANWGRSIRSSAANRLARSQESHGLGHRQRPDRGPKQIPARRASHGGTLAHSRDDGRSPAGHRARRGLPAEEAGGSAAMGGVTGSGGRAR